MSEIDRMLAANEAWAERFPGSRSVRPARGVAIVACMDSRMPLFQMLGLEVGDAHVIRDRKSTRLNSSHANISYAVFCLKKKKKTDNKDSQDKISNSSNTYSKK